MENLRTTSEEKYQTELKRQERDVNFLFDDFSEESGLFKTDNAISKFRKNHKEIDEASKKALKELKNVQNDQEEQNLGIMGDYYLKTHPELLNKLGSLKEKWSNQKDIESCHGEAADKMISQLENEDETDFHEFMNGNYNIKDLKRYEYND